MVAAIMPTKAEVFRCKVDGHTVYQQKPCADAISSRGSVEIRPPPASRSDATPPGPLRGVRTPTPATEGKRSDVRPSVVEHTQLSPEALAAKVAVEEALMLSGHRPIPATSPKLPPAPPLSPPQALSASCEFPWRHTLPGDFSVHVIASHHGKPISESIDDSGNIAGLLEVDVNSPSRPVALVLVAYYPTVWNIRRTAGTRIVGVWANGYHQPLVAGAGADVPVVVSRFDKGAPCATYAMGQSVANTQAKLAFGRDATLYHDIGTTRRAAVGSPLSVSQVFQFEGPPYQSLIDPTLKPGGRAGLAVMESAGLIRRASIQDVARWAAWMAECSPPPPMPPLAHPAPRIALVVPSDAWVVLKPMEYPPGLYGGNSALFYVFKGSPTPTGDPGHSTVRDANGVRCSRK